MSHESYDRRDDDVAASNRSFGIVFTVVFALIGLWPLARGGGVRIWAFVVCAIFGLCAAGYPAVLGPLNRGWSLLGKLMHRAVSPIVLGIMFFLVVTPIGLAMRALGKDPLRRRFDKASTTYWIDRSPPGPAPESLKDQF